MSDKEKDPPLADKPKASSLTDFELKALNLQKDGKIDELNKKASDEEIKKQIDKQIKNINDIFN